MAATDSAVAFRPRRSTAGGAASTMAVAASKMPQRPSGPILAQSATVNTMTAITTTAAPAASSSRAAVRVDNSGARRGSLGCARA